ncbi:Glycosyl hydrolases 36 [Sesbania bispinosa]|nr:Glycosyl hydrolases 36 [Sesbania bispinosa]
MASLGSNQALSLFTVLLTLPMKESIDGVKFASIGIIKMFNSGGVVKEWGSN